LEAFTKDQIQYQSGGPREISLLYDINSICNDFPFLQIFHREEKEIELNEGPFHKGKGSVLQITGKRI
jgi:hypothetical protein